MRNNGVEIDGQTKDSWMLDGLARRLIDPPLNAAGQQIAKLGISANQVTALGLAFGLAGAFAVGLQAYGMAIFLVAISRIADGLDGAIARATQKTDFGGYFDIVADFLFYGAVPLGFAFADPSANALIAAVLLLSFYFNGATFLGFAILAERRKLQTDMRGEKNFYFTDGLMEGTETILFLGLILIFPATFFWAAATFALLTFFTGCARLVRARTIFAATKSD